jgi:hypothetical protein
MLPKVHDKQLRRQDIATGDEQYIEMPKNSPVVKILGRLLWTIAWHTVCCEDLTEKNMQNAASKHQSKGSYAR